MGRRSLVFYKMQSPLVSYRGGKKDSKEDAMHSVGVDGNLKPHPELR
jgi:hypothetical protein